MNRKGIAHARNKNQIEQGRFLADMNGVETNKEDIKAVRESV